MVIWNTMCVRACIPWPFLRYPWFILWRRLPVESYPNSVRLKSSLPERLLSGECVRRRRPFNSAAGLSAGLLRCQDTRTGPAEITIHRFVLWLLYFELDEKVEWRNATDSIEIVLIALIGKEYFFNHSVNYTDSICVDVVTITFDYIPPFLKVVADPLYFLSRGAVAAAPGHSHNYLSSQVNKYIIIKI